MATTLAIKGAAGDDVSTYEIPDEWLLSPEDIEVNKGGQAVKDSVVAYMAGLRAGTASTKTRGKVSGGGSKPWRQKGTGRARSGSSRSPVWRGGGVVFGPQPRSYDKKVNRKVEKLALRRAFTDRLNAGEIIVVDKIAEVCDEKKEPKTKKMLAFLNAVAATESVLLLDADVEPEVALSIRNLPEALVLEAANVNTYLMLSFEKIVLTKAGLEALGKRLA